MSGRSRGSGRGSIGRFRTFLPRGGLTATITRKSSFFDFCRGSCSREFVYDLHRSSAPSRARQRTLHRSRVRARKAPIADNGARSDAEKRTCRLAERACRARRSSGNHAPSANLHRSRERRKDHGYLSPCRPDRRTRQEKAHESRPGARDSGNRRHDGYRLWLHHALRSRRQAGRQEQIRDRPLPPRRS